MGLFSAAKLFGMTIRESANDGSDFTNPDADYRRLFLGEDGALHLKDSAGTVTDVAGASGIAPALLDAKGDLIAASAADTAARLAVGTNGHVLVAASGETTGLKWSPVAVPTGTSFPGGPAAGDLFRRSDKDYMVFLYDGTRWVTEQLFPLSFSGWTGNLAADTAIGRIPMTHPHFADWWLVDFMATFNIAATNDGTKYWNATLRKMNSATTPTTIVSVTSQSEAANTTYSKYAAIDALLGSFMWLDVVGFKISTPTNINLGAMVTARGVAT
jgi:hypothetical protein